MGHRYNPGWASHMPLLIKTMLASKGPVLELGMGPFSTPLLHWLCKDAGRELVSYDNTKLYFDQNRKFAKDFHHVEFVKNDNWDSIEIEGVHWGVVFVDQHPSADRGKTAGRAAKCADYVVLHDSGDEYNDKAHNYDKIYHLFKYKYIYNEKGKPYTTVLSNVYDLDNLK